jgi:hypothetical protein
MRKMSIFLDRWYIACIRIMMMTCIVIFQSSQYQSSATNELTAQHGIDDDGDPSKHHEYDKTWKPKLLMRIDGLNASNELTAVAVVVLNIIMRLNIPLTPV